MLIELVNERIDGEWLGMDRKDEYGRVDDETTELELNGGTRDYRIQLASE